MKSVTVQELRQSLAGPRKPVVLDVRQPEETAGGHIEGAILIPLGELASRLAELEPHKKSPIVVNCKSGGRSAHACQLLEAEGFADVANLTGGILEWNK